MNILGQLRLCTLVIPPPVYSRRDCRLDVHAEDVHNLRGVGVGERLRDQHGEHEDGVEVALPLGLGGRLDVGDEEAHDCEEEHGWQDGTGVQSRPEVKI